MCGYLEKNENKNASCGKTFKERRPFYQGVVEKHYGKFIVDSSEVFAKN